MKTLINGYGNFDASWTQKMIFRGSPEGPSDSTEAEKKAPAESADDQAVQAKKNEVKNSFAGEPANKTEKGPSIPRDYKESCRKCDDLNDAITHFQEQIRNTDQDGRDSAENEGALEGAAGELLTFKSDIRGMCCDTVRHIINERKASGDKNIDCQDIGARVDAAMCGPIGEKTNKIMALTDKMGDMSHDELISDLRSIQTVFNHRAKGVTQQVALDIGRSR